MQIQEQKRKAKQNQELHDVAVNKAIIETTIREDEHKEQMAEKESLRKRFETDMHTWQEDQDQNEGIMICHYKITRNKQPTSGPSGRGEAACLNSKVQQQAKIRMKALRYAITRSQLKTRRL